MRAMVRIQSSSIAFRQGAGRAFATAAKSQLAFTCATPRSQNVFDPNKLRQSFRRSYAESTSPIAQVKKPRRFRVLRWLWRATYISTLGGLGYIAYGVYEGRHPEEQQFVDPSKQNLVILGMPVASVFLSSLLIEVQVLVGVLSPCSRSSTPKITTSPSSRLEIISSLLLFFRHVPLARLNIVQSWNPFEAS